MVGNLPKQLEVGNKYYDIRWDYKNCLLLMSALNDREFNEYERAFVLLDILFVNSSEIPDTYLQDAVEKGIWFLNCGKNADSKKVISKPLYNLEQDEQMIFSAINKVAGREIRLDDDLHFWTFMGYFNEVGEGMFSTVVAIRDKRNKHKKLEKWEQEFYRKNKDIVDLKTPLTEREKEEMRELNKLLGLEV